VHPTLLSSLPQPLPSNIKQNMTKAKRNYKTILVQMVLHIGHRQKDNKTQNFMVMEYNIGKIYNSFKLIVLEFDEGKTYEDHVRPWLQNLTEAKYKKIDLSLKFHII
jgi:hypothetical protein